jgi:hypothetical protein
MFLYCQAKLGWNLLVMHKTVSDRHKDFIKICRVAKPEAVLRRGCYPPEDGIFPGKRVAIIPQKNYICNIKLLYLHSSIVRGVSSAG